MLGMPNQLGFGGAMMGGGQPAGGGMPAGGGLRSRIQDYAANNPEAIARLGQARDAAMARRQYGQANQTYNQGLADYNQYANYGYNPAEVQPGINMGDARELNYGPNAQPPFPSAQTIQAIAGGPPSRSDYYGGMMGVDQGSGQPPPADGGAAPGSPSPYTSFSPEGWASAQRPQAMTGAAGMPMGSDPMATLNSQLAGLGAMQQAPPTQYEPYSTPPMLPAELTAPLYGWGSFLSSPYNIMGMAGSVLPYIL